MTEAGKYYILDEYTCKYQRADLWVKKGRNCETHVGEPKPEESPGPILTGLFNDHLDSKKPRTWSIFIVKYVFYESTYQYP
jgi:hypothetical protein